MKIKYETANGNYQRKLSKNNTSKTKVFVFTKENEERILMFYAALNLKVAKNVNKKRKFT